MSVFMRMLAALLLSAGAAVGHAAPAGTTPEPVRVLFVGNSLTYGNNLPRMVQAIAASQDTGPRIETVTYAIPGAELDTLWDEDHAAAALRKGGFDVVVLQERGGVLACMAMNRRDPACRRSERAHRRFAELAAEHGARVLLFAAWPPLTSRDLNDPQHRDAVKETTMRSYQVLARLLGNDAAPVAVVPAVVALVDLAGSRDAPEVLADGVHPTVAASLTIAAQLYNAITGRKLQPADLMLDFPLLPANALVNPDAPVETQPQLAGDGGRVLIKAEVLEPYFALANRY